jgi:uncharacterized membrane protein
VKPGQTSTATLSFNSTVAGIYSLTIAGRSGSSSHFADVTITVEDFKISASLFDSTIPAGSNRTLSIHISSLYDFSGTVTLEVNVSPKGPGVEISPGEVVLTPGETGDASLIIDLPSTVSTGSYTITIDASGSGIVHRTILPLAVTRTSSGPPSPSQVSILGLQWIQFVALVCLMVGVGILLAYKKLFLDR